ncbi:MAG TPA: thiol reductant ABC exporter subunit CydC [Aldersonia sp.]
MASDLRRALSLLDLRPGRIAAAIAAGTAGLGSGLALAAVAAWLIARAWQMPPVLDLSVAVVTVRALGISRGVFRYLERLASHDAAFRGTTAARAGIYARLAGGDPGAVTALRRGDLLTRTGADVDTIGEVVVRALIPITVGVLLAVAAVGLLATISAAGAAVLALSLVVAGVFAPMLAARASRAAEHASMTAGARYADDAITALDHAPELRVAGRLDEVVERARVAARQSGVETDRAVAGASFAAAATPLGIAVSVLGSLLVGIAIYGPDGGTPGDMTPMALAILVLVPLSAFEAAAMMPAAAVALSRARVAAGRVMGVLDESGYSVPGRGVPLPDVVSVRADGVVCGWPGGARTAAIDLGMAAGSRVAVVGPSGVGKSSLLMTLAGLLAPVDGRVRVGGVDVADLDQTALRHAVTFFAEDAHLFDTSLLENLRVARGTVTPDEARAAIVAVGLGEWLDGLPDGVDTTLTGGDRAVSGGQRRRILLARALLSPARVLLLDEPTENLDAEDGAALLRSLLDRASGLVSSDRAVVVVTHQLPSDTAADRVVVLDGGVNSADREKALPSS